MQASGVPNSQASKHSYTRDEKLAATRNLLLLCALLALLVTLLEFVFYVLIKFPELLSLIGATSVGIVIVFLGGWIAKTSLIPQNFRNKLLSFSFRKRHLSTNFLKRGRTNG